MKALLFLYLLASISCFNLLNAGLCIFGNEKIISLAGNIISSVKDKDFGNVINLLLSNFSELKNIVANCLESEKEPNLQAFKRPKGITPPTGPSPIIKQIRIIGCKIGCSARREKNCGCNNLFKK